MNSTLIGRSNKIPITVAARASLRPASSGWLLVSTLARRAQTNSPIPRAMPMTIGRIRTELHAPPMISTASPDSAMTKAMSAVHEYGACSDESCPATLVLCGRRRDPTVKATKLAA